MNKKILIFVCLILFIISVAGVSASEDVSQTDIGGTSNLDNGGDILSISSSENEVLGAGEGTFTQLAGLINDAGDNGTVNLNMSYKSDGSHNTGIIINNPITINGNGFTIDGNNEARIFHITATGSVTLNNITFKNGYSNDNGGAIYIANDLSDSSFKNLVFEDNVAKENGGAIYFFGKSTNNLFENVMFENNTAQSVDSGAINFFNKVENTTFDRVTFYKNRAGKSMGGAINIDAGIENSIFNNTFFIENTAGRSGGAISITGDIKSVTFENADFLDNKAVSNNGGAIVIGAWNPANLENTNFKNVRFINNTANSNGGAIHLEYKSASNSFEKVKFINNTAQSEDGGAINFHGNVNDTTFNDVSFINNSALSSMGGAINIDEGIDYSTFNDTTFTNNTAGISAGAISITGKNRYNRFENSVFLNNSAKRDDGGAINIGSYLHSDLENTVFKNVAFAYNTALENGGAIYVTGKTTSTTFENMIFLSNVARSKDGGAMRLGAYNYQYTSSDNSFKNILFANNTAHENGGALYVGGPSISNTFETVAFINNTAEKIDGGAINFYRNVNKNTFNNIYFLNNSASSTGGAINIDFGLENSMFNNTYFINNTADSAGAIAIAQSYKLNSIENTEFINNNADYIAGAFYVGSGIVADLENSTFKNVKFIKNTAGSNGGALYVVGSAQYNDFVNVKFENNTAQYNGGGLYVLQNATSNYFENITFINNTAKEENGGAINFGNQDVYKTVSNIFNNTYFIANTAGQNGGAIYVYGSSSSDSFKDTAFISNIAETMDGGAINFYGEVDDASFDNVLFYNNSAEYSMGGAINIDSGLFNAVFNNTYFIKNTAHSAGALSINGASLSNTFENGAFAHNTAEYNGGAINFATYHKTVINDTVFNGTVFFNNSAENNGGAIALGGGEVSDLENTIFNNVKFIKNTAEAYGGAIYVIGNAQNNNFENVTFKENTAEYDGGGLYVYMAAISNNFENVTFINNTAKKKNGGAINFGGEDYYVATSNIFNNSNFIANTAGSNGGALYVFGPSSSNSFKRTVFESNIAESVDGGAINFYGKADAAIFDYVLFYNNTAAGMGGAINIDNGLEDSVFNNTLFIENTGRSAGALSVNEAFLSNIFENVAFVNNTAENNGGAINFGTYSYTVLENNAFKGTFFINNTAANRAGAIFLFGEATTNNTIENSAFINNTGKEVMYIGYSTDAVIKDSLFINNDENSIYVDGGDLTLINDWFGNNATNYDEKPDVNVEMDNWLYLNATVNPAAIDLNETSTVNFKLQSYKTSGDPEEYGGPLNVILDLEATLGTLNQTFALLNQDVLYTPSKSGNASITGRFENAYYTITLENKKTPTEIILGNETFDLKIDDVVDANATLIPEDAGNLTYTSSNESVAVVVDGQIMALAEGTAVITVSFDGNDEYYAAENQTISVTVRKIASAIQLTDDGYAVYIDETRENLAVLLDEDGNNVTDEYTLTYTSSDESIVKIVNDTIVGVSEGLAVITVSFDGNDKYEAAENVTFYVGVFKIPTVITVATTTLDVKVLNITGINATLTPGEAGNLTYTSSNSSIVMVMDGVIIPVAKGSAIITLSFDGNDKYAAAENKTITVNVSLNDASVIVENDTLDLEIDDTYVINATTVPTIAILLNLTYTSSNESVATVDENGTVTAVGEGTAIITLSVGDDKIFAKNSTEVSVTVSKISTEITVLNDTIETEILNITMINATLTPGEAGNLTYTSSNSSIVMVVGDVIVPVSKGTAIITVSFDGNDKYAAAENKTITVNVILNDASVIVENDTLELNVEDIYAINATTVPLTPELLNITYTSSDESVATVDENGIVTAVGEGTAIITVTVGDDIIFAKNSTEVSVTVSKIPTEIIVQNDTLEMNVGDVVDPVVSLMPSNAGNLSFMVSDPNVILINGSGVITAVGEGNATVTISFMGNDKYTASNATITVTVSKATIQPEAATNDTAVSVYVPEDATGNITLTAGNETFTAPIENGVATFNTDDLPSGDYNATISYPGDDKYEGFEFEYPISIEDQYILSAEDLTKYYGGSERFVANLTDSKGNPISGAVVSITLNGREYTRTTNDNGQVSMAINLNSGEYPVVVSYNETTINVKVTVLSTVNGTDVVKVFRNGTQYYATFLDSEGNFLAHGTAVRFNINGVFYERKVSGNQGLAKLNLNLEQGEYILTAMNLQTGENAVNNITILSRLTENKDITKYYRNATQYTVTVIGDDGNPAEAGETVKFNINGVFYERQTDVNGIAKLNINLEPGDYVITAEYMGCRVSNNITVLPVLSAEDLTKMYGTPDPFVATLVDGQGQPYAGQKIEFNINGVFYTRTTDDNGQAKLNINLMAGKYIITSTYNGASISNTITVNPV